MTMKTSPFARISPSHVVRLTVLACLLGAVPVASAQHASSRDHRGSSHGPTDRRNPYQVDSAHHGDRRGGHPAGTWHAHPGMRGSPQIMADLDAGLARMADLGLKLDGLTKGRMTGNDRAQIRKVSQRMRTLSANLRQLHRELAAALAREHGEWDAPVVLDPPMSIPELSGPYPMSPADMNALAQRLQNESFESSRKRLLLDAIQAGAYFDTQQALRIMGMFGFESTKVDVGARLCEVITERGALPTLIASLSFESSRKALRQRTGGHCGRP